MNPFWLFLIVGIGLLAVELLVFQFTTFWLFFVGIGALVAAMFAWLYSDASYLLTTGVFVVASAMATAVMYMPLRRWQREPSGIAGNNAVGQKVKVTKEITPEAAGSVYWSGSEWQAELAEDNSNSNSIGIGEYATVISVEGIRLLVSRA